MQELPTYENILAGPQPLDVAQWVDVPTPTFPTVAGARYRWVALRLPVVTTYVGDEVSVEVVPGEINGVAIRPMRCRVLLTAAVIGVNLRLPARMLLTEDDIAALQLGGVALTLDSPPPDAALERWRKRLFGRPGAK